MTLTLEQEALMLRVLDAEEAGTAYYLSRAEGSRDYVTVRGLQTLELVTMEGIRRFHRPTVRSTCQGTWLHDALNIRVRLRAAGLSTRSCPLRTV